jgi:hypothetical protein
VGMDLDYAETFAKEIKNLKKTVFECPRSVIMQSGLKLGIRLTESDITNITIVHSHPVFGTILAATLKNRSKIIVTASSYGISQYKFNNKK